MAGNTNPNQLDVPNIQASFNSLSVAAKTVVPSIVQNNTWDLAVISRPLFTAPSGYYLVLEEILFVSETDVRANAAETLTFVDSFDSNSLAITWNDLLLNQVGAVSRYSFDGGLNGRIIKGNLSANDSGGAGVYAGIVHAYVIGFLIPSF